MRKVIIQMTVAIMVMISALHLLGSADIVWGASLKAPVLVNNALNGDSISNRWKTVKGSQGYEVFRALSSEGRFVKIQTVKGGDNTEAVNAGLRKDRIYYYKVRAYKDSLSSGRVYSPFSGTEQAKATDDVYFVASVNPWTALTKVITIDITNKSKTSLDISQEAVFLQDTTMKDAYSEVLDTMKARDVFFARLDFKHIGEIIVKPGYKIRLDYMGNYFRAFEKDSGLVLIVMSEGVGYLCTCAYSDTVIDKVSGKQEKNERR